MERKLLVPLSMICRSRGGIPRFNQMLCLALDRIAPKLGIEATILSMSDTEEDLSRAGTAWTNARFIPGGGKARLSWKVLWRCLRDRPDAMLIGHLGMAPLGLWLRPLLRRGYAIVVHGTEAWTVQGRASRRAVRKAARILAVSRYTGERLCAECGADEGKVRVLPNTLDPAFHAGGGEKVVPRASRLGSGVEMLSVARLWAEQGRKGVDHAILALHKLAREVPALSYRVIGKGSDKERLVRLADELGLGDRVIFEQDLSDEDLAMRYAACDFFILPSGQEGFGIVFLEAMNWGKACIATNEGGIPEVVKDGETGILVSYGDEGALVEAVRRLATGASLRDEMGRAGKRRLEEQFVFDRFVKRLDGCLAEWLTGGDEN